MPIETLIHGSKQQRTAYTQRQLRNKLERIRAGLAHVLPKGTRLMFPGNVQLTREEVIAAIDSELATYAAFDALLNTVQVQRRALTGRLPLLATALGELSHAIVNVVGRAPALRQFGLTPGKKPRRLKPEERMASTEKLRATRRRNGTSAKPKRR